MSAIGNITRRSEPQQELEKLAADALKVIPEGSGIRAIVSLTVASADIGRGTSTCASGGYEDDQTMIEDMVRTLDAVARAMGRSFTVNIGEP